MALRLAIIEDNADLLDELLAWLGYRGFEVWGSRSAEAFWRQLHSHPVDIVLIDTITAALLVGLGLTRCMRLACA